MRILSRRTLFFRICVILLTFFPLALRIPQHVQADVGVQPVLPGGSSIQPHEETPIQMASEVVTMNVRAATSADNALVALKPDSYGYEIEPVWYPGVAEVKADFKMNNPTSAPVTLTVWFPLASTLENVQWNFNPGEIVPRITSFQVSIDGVPTNYIVSELPNPKGADKPLLPWASFPVTFAAGKETIIQVSYNLPLQPQVKGYGMALYYVFQNGAGWDGSIGQAELIVNLPYPASIGTMASIQPDHFTFSYMGISNEPAKLPSGVVLAGNQARWTWKNFEPGPDDDFAVWLLRVDKWKGLKAAQEVVRTSPQDGKAWLDLAIAYHSLAASYRNSLMLFSSTYLNPGIDAYRKVISLLPEESAAHAGLALLTLAPYMTAKNAPADVIQSVQNEYQIAIELESKNPTQENESSISRWLLPWLKDALSSYFYNSATATMDAATQAVYNRTSTARATLDYATTTAWVIVKATFMACRATMGPDLQVCSITASPTTTLTPTPPPTSTTLRSPTLSPPLTTTETSDHSLTQIIIAAGVVIAIIIVGFLAVKRTRRDSKK
jgi:hypothetical protein